MAVNGVTEAFVFAVIPSKLLSSYNLLLCVFSVIYIFASIVLVSYGSIGLILANCVNMTARIVYSMAFLVRFLQRARAAAMDQLVVPALTHFWFKVLPDPLLFTSLLLSAAATQFSLGAWHVRTFTLSAPSAGTSAVLSSRFGALQAFGGHVGCGALLLVLVAACFWWREQEFVRSFRDLFGLRKRA